MILRAPTMLDHQFILECYADWPQSERQGPITAERVVLWIQRWMARTDEISLIAEETSADGTVFPVGYVQYRTVFVGAFIDNLIVHPGFRELGHSKTMRRLLHDKLTAEGVVVAEFNTLPGPLEGKYPENRVTWDQDV